MILSSIIILFVYIKPTYIKNQVEKSLLYFNELYLINSDDHSKINEGRIRLANVGFKLFKNRPFFGYGIGSVEEKQLEEYNLRGYKIEFNEKQNTHNYYLNLLLIGGIPLLVLFFLLIKYLFNISIKTRDVLLFSFSLIIVLNLLTENFLSRIYGIFSFSMFLGILLNPSISDNLKTNSGN